MKNILLVLFLALMSCSAVAADVCGSPGEKPSTKSVTVNLQSKPVGPAFYYRTGLYSVAFISQAKMAAFLDKLSIPESASPAKALVNAIRADMPLREDRDLFQYNYSDWFNLNIIESMLTHFFEQGDASLMELGGDMVKQITIVHERTPGYTLTRIYAGEKGINEILTTRGCISD